jgi:hypothetical protein
VGRDVNQCHNFGIVRSFGDYRSAIAVSYYNARSVLLSDHALRRSHVFFEGRLWLLNDADLVAIFDENVVNAFPALAICPGTMNKNNVPYLRSVFLRCHSKTVQQRNSDNKPKAFT